MYKSTGRWKKYWAERRLDWKKEYLDTFDHPHRKLIIDALQGRKFNSLMEIGCASGPNLVNVKRFFPHVQVGGCDVSKDAIQLARQAFPNGIFDVCSATNLYFTNSCVDVALSDACLIYLDRKNVRKALLEMKRVTNKYIILVEFHHTSFWKRLALKLGAGYNAYRWDRLLKELDFHDIEMRKIPKEVWSGTPWEEFGWIITART